MTEVRRSVLVPFSAEDMFDLIEGAEHYPNFLPWCAAVTVLARDETMVRARLTVDYHGVRFDFATRNPKKRPEYLGTQIEEGPFRRFEGDWRLTPLADNACRIDFRLLYDLHMGVAGRLADPVFNGIANTMVNAFVARAERVYGLASAR